MKSADAACEVKLSLALASASTLALFTLRFSLSLNLGPGVAREALPGKGERGGEVPSLTLECSVFIPGPLCSPILAEGLAWERVGQ